MMTPARILLISLSNIGDAVLTTPVLEALHRQWPSAPITVLVGPRAVALFERDPRVAQVWPYEKQDPWWRKVGFLSRLHRQRFDLVVDLRHTLWPWLLGARWRSPLVRARAGARHRMEIHLEVLRRMGIPTEGAVPRLYTGPEDEHAAARWVADLPPGLPLVAVAPGARSHLKRWTAEGFAAVCDAIMMEFGAQVILVGDAGDRPIAERVIGAMRQSPMNLTGRTTLRQLVALFRRTRLVLTNDSACLHLAVAAQAPVAAIFGPTDPRKYGPTGPRDAVVRLGLVCSPCELALCPYGHECMTLLPPRDVLAAVRRQLATGPGAPLLGVGSSGTLVGPGEAGFAP